VFLAAAGPWLLQVSYPLYLLIANHPAFLPDISKRLVSKIFCFSCIAHMGWDDYVLIFDSDEFKDHRVKFVNDVRNCEDIVLDEARGAAILSCDAGRDKWNTVMVRGFPSLCFSRTSPYLSFAMIVVFSFNLRSN
jgi:hypothetical protein